LRGLRGAARVLLDALVARGGAAAGARGARCGVKSERRTRLMVPPGSSDEWYTLPRDFEPLYQEFRFTVDAFAPRGGCCYSALRIGRWWDKDVDAFRQDCAGERVWAQPPYSPKLLRRAAEWCAKQGRVAELLVALLPARTDRDWWHEHIVPELDEGRVRVRYLKGRKRFGWPGRLEGHGGSSARDPTLLVIWGRP
jgi:hypothetical protein